MFKAIYLDAPSLGSQEKRLLAEAIDSGYVSSVGPFVNRFETEFASYLKMRNAVSLQSGTAALHMSLSILGIGKGDEVIVPALTFIATVNPIMYVGAKPVFVDVDSSTWNIDPSDIERRITRRTKAIIPVHLYGNPCDMRSIVRISRAHKINIIEDATESLGATHEKKFTGTLGTLGCFSFNGNKVITTGGGGMVVSPDATKIKKIKFMVNQAKGSRAEYFHPEIGFNYRMTNLEAAVGLAQLSKLKRFLEKKRRINRIYRQELKCVEGISFQKTMDTSTSSYWFTCVRFDTSLNTALLQRDLYRVGIPTRRVFIPIIALPPYRKFRKGAYPRSDAIYQSALALPSSTLNTTDDIQRICWHMRTLVKKYWKKKRKR